MAVKRFVKKKPLSNTLEDFLITRIGYDSRLKQIVSFSVSQVFFKNGKAFEIARFDTSHGFLHFHKFFSKEKQSEKISFEISYESFNECKQRILKNWRSFRQEFLETQRF